LPYATQFTTNGTPSFPTINGVTNTYGSSKYWAHETGVNEIDANGVETAITSYIQSGDYDLDRQQGLNGAGEDIMRVSRFIPDFKNLSGNAKVTMFFRNYPGQTEQSDANGPLIVLTDENAWYSVNTREIQGAMKVVARGRTIAHEGDSDVALLLELRSPSGPHHNICTASSSPGAPSSSTTLVQESFQATALC